MTDIVERLRRFWNAPVEINGMTLGSLVNPDGPEAADTIEQLRARIAELEK